MARARNRRRLSSGFNLGGQQAEADPLLELAFYETSQYRAISSTDDQHCFLIGRTGSGKSALLQQLESDHQGHVVRIAPEDLGLTYVADLQVIRWLDQQGVHLDPLFIALWKHVLLVEIIKHRYQVHSADAKQNFMAALGEKIRKDKSKVQALGYLDEFQGKFWCEADERVREIADKFETQVKAAAGVTAGLDLHAEGGSTQSSEERRELVLRYQRVVNETQLPRLNQMIKVLDEDILATHQNHVFVVIDDLDLDWVDDRVTNSLIRCLFRAVLDLKKVEHLKILVALRTNIFEALDFGQRTGGQEEKFRALSMRVRWSEADLEAMLDTRAVVAAERLRLDHDGPTSIRAILPAKNKTRGDALEYILRRTLLRPRDAIAYFNECLADATNNPRLTWDRIHQAEDSYSRNRLLALRDEWKPTFPDIEKIFSKFEGVPSSLSPDELAAILDEVAMLPGDDEFEGGDWLGRMLIEFWRSGSSSWGERYGPLIRFLFDIGFLGVAPAKTQPTYADREPGFLDRPNRVNTCERFFVHPAFRSALDCTESRSVGRQSG